MKKYGILLLSVALSLVAITASVHMALATQIVNGVCGSANSTSVLTAPTAHLCSAGTANHVSGTGPWTWTCAGSNGGTTANCSATVLVPAITVTSPNSGTFSSTQAVDVKWTMNYVDTTASLTVGLLSSGNSHGYSSLIKGKSGANKFTIAGGRLGAGTYTVDIRDTVSGQTIIGAGTGSFTVTDPTTCVATAINAREAAIGIAMTTYTGALSSAYSTRAAALQSAYQLATSAAIKTAVAAAWTAFNNTFKSARTAWQTARDNTWKTYKAAATACRAPSGTGDDSHSNSELSPKTTAEVIAVAAASSALK